MNKSFGLFVRTYHRDAPRLRYLLKSYSQFCTGFSKVTVVCPDSSQQAIAPVVAEFDFVELQVCPNYENDFIGQQITKLRAPKYINTDYVVHVDSDCIFVRPFNPDMYMRDNIPLLYSREYNYFYKNKIYMPWQQITSRLMLRQVDYEFMALFPLFYPRGIYEALESWVFDNHQINYEVIDSMVAKQDEFSEFNLLGAFSYYWATELYHVHENWGAHNPVHYVRQFCNEGRDRREISAVEKEIIEQIIV